MRLINDDRHILIVGLGLIGGSYAAALKKLGFDVYAITKEQKSVDYAVEKGIIDRGYDYINAEEIGKADIVIFALYPHVFRQWITDNQQYFKSGAVITDVTGVKTSVVYEIQSILRDDVEFIAAHPMAGREVYGVENSTPAMFHGANYIVTPTEKNTQSAIDLCLELGRLLGFANVSVLSPEKHDEMIGFVSQLTHCIAVSLMTCNDTQHLEDYTGDSFRDLTRIARINDEMWSELFVLNKQPLIQQMNLFIDEFLKLKSYLEKNDVDSMRKMMRYSTQRRALFDKRA